MSREVSSTGDARSVGELLLDADLHARSALWDVDPDQAKARERSWREVVEAAASVWASIPDRDRDPTMAQISARTAKPNASWPGGGKGDPLLESAAASLERAADLIGARRHPTAPLSEGGHRDAAAARTRTMHTVYVASHAAALSLDHHVRDLRRIYEAGRLLPAGASIVHARAARDRATAVERLAGLYLETRWPAALAGQHQDRADAGRLESAAAWWDVVAHRVLTRTPTIANLTVVARVQGELAIATSVVVAASVRVGQVDVTAHAERFAPAIGEAERAWASLGSDLRQMTGRDRQLDPELLLTANELRASLHEITHDHVGFVRPSVLAARTDLEDVLSALRRSVAAAPDIAHAVRGAVQDPRLTAPARAVHAVAVSRLGPDPEEAWVNPSTLAQRSQIPLPRPVQALFVEHADRVLHAARAADSSAGALNRLTGSPPPPKPSSQTLGRAYEDRQISQSGRDGPGVGCER